MLRSEEDESTGSLTLPRNGLLDTYSARSREVRPLLWRRRTIPIASSSPGRVFSASGSGFFLRSRLIRRSALVRLYVGVGIRLGTLGLRVDVPAPGDASLKGELETRLLLRTWLKEEDVRRTGV